MALRSLVHILLCSVSRALVPLRAPCTPLNVVSPYQSTWSCSDNLFDAWPQHWNGAPIGMYGLLKVDSEVFRFMGDKFLKTGTVTQKSVEVAPTTTTYVFEAAGISLTVKFATPSIGLDEDIVAASRPVTHVTFDVSSLDGKDHDVQIYYDNSGEGAVQSNRENIKWSRVPSASNSSEIMQVGTTKQAFLAQGSDSINWGQWLVATPTSAVGLHTSMNRDHTCRQAFVDGTYFSVQDDVSGPRQVSDRWPVLSVAWNLGKVLADAPASRHLILAYDQVQSQRFFGTNMAPLWRSRWTSAGSMLDAAELARESDLAATKAFDAALITNLTSAGGDKYAALASLVYRQVIGGTQAVWNPLTKEPWVFMKEISSDGDVSTVDVIYPAFPFFQYLYPEYFRLILMPLFVYANNATKAYGMDIPYNLPWAPHHLGHWPVCDLQPNRQEQMPVEESGNMLIIIAALYQRQGSMEYLKPYWPVLTTWADYIVRSLPDPGNQLCTDDFEGPSPHNTNLAAKGIVALEAFAGLLHAKGDVSLASTYKEHALRFAANWTSAAHDGDHYRIQFNLPGTWSQKYNMFWQKALGLGAFPDEVFNAENAYYQTKMETCGVPLDDRHPYTKSDWSLWSASMGSQEQFESIAAAVFRFADTTPSRVPLSDWYDVTTCVMKGFRARPVQGGLYAKMLVSQVEGPAIVTAYV
eukprot:TRINITY_DN5807_c0_g2_i1.p1 TRINITY_DN5807_c0_g2~~TRINITY_DN5807_c0_g2_i1.p1  ORF type:complete len:694 (+),score=93.34 TRINITY_DN5807_c0_g2_i1:73-2154(+)